ELIQHETLPEKIAAKMRTLLDNPKNYLKIRRRLKAVKEKLGKAGAPERAADTIISVLKK
ncbi:MAG: lipid-A-disaccharide synthase, partial [Pseudomonadota bacterium]|nr:lipid-A-disaccharide synthase [Pseudomonadota bacterium]